MSKILIPSRRAIYIDESYQLIEKLRPDSFYFLASVYFPSHRVPEMRRRLSDCVGSEIWHSTEQLKSPQGRAKLVQLCELIATNAEVSIFTKVPLFLGDKLGEASRASLMKSLLTHFEPDSTIAEHRFVYEGRLPGVQTKADERTISELKRLGKLHTDVDIRARRKEDEPLLWLADTVATAFRQNFTSRNSDYWDALKSCSSVINT